MLSASKIKKKYKVFPVFYYRTNEEELQSIYNVEESIKKYR